MNATSHLLAGFAEPVHDSQRVFRAAMNAFARPGTVHRISDLPAARAPFNRVGCALILALADHEAPVWLDARLAAIAAVVAHIRFHTGARIVDDPSRSAFAVVSDARLMPPLSAFATGSLNYPDRSTTLILQVQELGNEGGPTLRGPGIEATRTLRDMPLPNGFGATMAANHKLFPCGIDVLLAADAALAGLPRTTTIEE